MRITFFEHQVKENGNHKLFYSFLVIWDGQQHLMCPNTFKCAQSDLNGRGLLFMKFLFIAWLFTLYWSWMTTLISLSLSLMFDLFFFFIFSDLYLPFLLFLHFQHTIVITYFTCIFFPFPAILRSFPLFVYMNAGDSCSRLATSFWSYCFRVSCLLDRLGHWKHTLCRQSHRLRSGASGSQLWPYIGPENLSSPSGKR